MKKDKTPYFFLVPKEEETMKVLWESEKNLSASEIADRIPNRTWPVTSIQSILRGLEKKKAIRVAKVTKLGKSYGRLFTPNISANDYAIMQFNRFYKGNIKQGFLAALLGTLDKEEIELTKLQELIDSYREE